MSCNTLAGSGSNGKGDITKRKKGKKTVYEEEREKLCEMHDAMKDRDESRRKEITRKNREKEQRKGQKKIQ